MMGAYEQLDQILERQDGIDVYKRQALTIIKTFKSEEIISRILDEFRRYELDFTATGPIKFETPKDQTQATGALHSEHFMLRSRDAKDID